MDFLIVEDSRIDRRMISGLMKRVNRDALLTHVDSLATARAALGERGYAMILLDNTLPDGWGADFAMEIAGHSQWSTIPVVMVTGWPSPHMFAKAQAGNVREIVDKNELATWAISGELAKRIARWMH